MTLDPRTLIFAIIVGSALKGGALLAVTRGHLGEIPGASRWAVMEDLLRDADTAMYQAKAVGRDTWSSTSRCTSTHAGVSRGERAALRELKALGVRTHLDDFGAGLSSLSLLRTLPLDGLKIDRSFLDAANRDRDVQAIAILSAIISLGHSLGKTIAAEGISEREQVATVLALDCDLAQGYLFGPPMAAEEAEAARTTDYSSYCVAA